MTRYSLVPTFVVAVDGVGADPVPFTNVPSELYQVSVKPGNAMAESTLDTDPVMNVVWLLGSIVGLDGIVFTVMVISSAAEHPFASVPVTV